MTGPDYPLLTVPGFELYQLAQLATFVADALARHRRAAEAGARNARRAAARDVHAGRLALARATGNGDLAGGPLPRPLDIATFREAEQLHGGLSVGEAEVVSLAALGRSSWAVIGRVAGIGPVGAEVGDHGLADALRSHLLTQPAHELTGWAVTDQPTDLGLDRWGTADEAATVAALDPERAQHRVVGAALHGISPQLDRTIERHFRTPAQPTSVSGGPAGDGFAAANAALTPPRSPSPRPATQATPGAPDTRTGITDAEQAGSAAGALGLIRASGAEQTTSASCRLGATAASRVRHRDPTHDSMAAGHAPGVAHQGRKVVGGMAAVRDASSMRPSGSPSRFASDPMRTASRVAELEGYFNAQVLDGDRMICHDLDGCRHSATRDNLGRARPDVGFVAGQLPHVGAHYELSENGRPMRILVIAMETGRSDEHVSMPRRRTQLAESAALAMTRRNPHMQGVMNALRLVLGRDPGPDRAGEMLDIDGDAPVHLFDAYAMTNLRLCSAYTIGTTASRATPTMSRNCSRHLEATIRMLEPTLCIVQGVEVSPHVARLMRRTVAVGPQLRRGEIAEVPVLVASFTHPSAHADLRWGGLSGVPYLHKTVVPTLRAARRMITEPGAPPPPPRASGPAAQPRPGRSSPPQPTPAGAPTPERGWSPSGATVRLSTRELGVHARRIVCAEIEHRGGRVAERQVGRRIELRVTTAAGRTVGVRVLSRRAGDWQTSIREGDAIDADPDRFWVLIDLATQPPTFYVVPASWMSRDIRREHDEYLACHGGRRAVTADSTHHRIQTSRVKRWQERWGLLLS